MVLNSIPNSPPSDLPFGALAALSYGISIVVLNGIPTVLRVGISDTQWFDRPRHHVNPVKRQ